MLIVVAVYLALRVVVLRVCVWLYCASLSARFVLSFTTNFLVLFCNKFNDAI
jgi:hypothetical protein